MSPPEEASTKAAAEIEVIELWRLPLDFYELSPEAQWKAFADVTVPAKRLAGPRGPCPMALWEQAYFVCWSLLTLGLPLAMLPLTVLIAALRPGLLACWLGCLGVLALHPIAPFRISHRRRMIGLILSRYFTLTVLVDRQDTLMRHCGTPAVDGERSKVGLPVIALACPHGVLNFGAVGWVFFMRWIAGIDQYTAGADITAHVPGIRYLMSAIWGVKADRKSLKRHLQERPTEVHPRGGVVGIVPDGIAGIFHSSPGRDVLHLGKKRGLMRIACEEGAFIISGWFPGVTDCFTIVQDPCGVMRWISRRLRVSIFLFYGRWGLPIPRRTPISMCPRVMQARKIPEPTEEDVERLHQEVYGDLARQFDRLKHYAGFGDRTLVVT